MVFKFLILLIFWELNYYFVISQEQDSDSLQLYIAQMDSLKSISPQKSLFIADKIRGEVLQYADFETKGLFFNLIGVCYKNRGKYKEAIISYEEALKYYQQSNHEVALAGVFNNLGYAHRVQGEYKKSLNYFLKSLKIFKDKGNTKHIITVLNNIGSLYFVQKKYEKAKEYFQEALDSTYKINDFASQSLIFNNLGEIALRSHQYEEAKTLFLKSNQLKTQLKDKRLKASTLANLFAVYHYLGKPDSSLYYYREAKNLFLDIKDSLGLQKLDIQYANLNINKDNSKSNYEEIQKLEKSVIELKEKNISPTLVQVYHNLSGAYAKDKNFQKAYFYLNEFYKLNDSLNNIKVSQYIDQLEALFRNKEKNERIKFLEQQNKIETLENEKMKNTNFWLGLTIIFVLLILALSIILIYIKQKNQKVLEQKNLIIEKSLQEKELLLREIHHRVKNNLQIISSLLNLQAKQQNISAEELLNQSKDRIYAMSVIHEKLYQTPDFRSIDLKDYLNSLLEYFSETYGLEAKKILIHLKSDSMIVDIEKIVPCGLIVNEIISNAIKHAFEESSQNKIITVQAKKNDNFCLLTIGDNGKGLPPDFQLEKKQSLGFRLIQGLVKQIKGEFQIFNHHGTTFNIQFSL